MGYQAPLITLSAIAITLLVPAFAWHIKTINIPAITLIVWLLLMDIKIFVDAIIWGADDFFSHYNGVGYCDVMIKLETGANVGISSSSAAILFNLYRILKADSVIPELRSFKKIGLDLLICLATPVVVMGLSYLIQSRRYYIFQYSGCQNILSATWVIIPVYSIWLVIWSFTGVVFAILIIFTFFRKRKDVSDILRCTNSGLTVTRFAKLLIFCIIIILMIFPLSLYIFIDGIKNLYGTYNFKIVHSKSVWFTILYVQIDSPYYTTWIYLAMSYIVFIFFGLGSDAIKMYVSFLSKIGFGPLIEKIRQRQQNKKLLKADRMVSGVLKSIGLSTMNSANVDTGTSFDFENQCRVKTDGSPTLTVSPTMFADKHEIPKGKDHYRFFEGLNGSLVDFDDDDLNYLNMIHEEDMTKEQVKSDDSLYTFEDLSQTKVESDIGYVYKLEHKS